VGSIGHWLIALPRDSSVDGYYWIIATFLPHDHYNLRSKGAACAVFGGSSVLCECVFRCPLVDAGKVETALIMIIYA
jgi:hypothetical protein